MKAIEKTVAKQSKASSKVQVRWGYMKKKKAFVDNLEMVKSDQDGILMPAGRIMLSFKDSPRLTAHAIYYARLQEPRLQVWRRLHIGRTDGDRGFGRIAKGDHQVCTVDPLAELGDTTRQVIDADVEDAIAGAMNTLHDRLVKR